MAAGGYAVAVVGPTGLVGQEIVRELHRRGFVVGRLGLFGTPRTAGTTFSDVGGEGRVELLTSEAARGYDLVFLAAGREVADEFARRVAADGTWVVDTSSALRLDEDVALVVPEVNAAALAECSSRIAASPSPTSVALSVALAPLLQYWSLRRVVVSTYQGAAGAGTRAVQGLARETVRLLNAGSPEGTGASRPLAFDCVPVIGALDGAGMSGHERLVMAETRRILGAEVPPLHVTAVRVPIFVGTCLSVVVESDGPMPAEEVSAALRGAPGILLHEGDGANPTPRGVAGSPATHIGRVREDPTVPHGVALWITIDTLAKGRAVNAVQIAELLVRDHLLECSSV